MSQITIFDRIVNRLSTEQQEILILRYGNIENIAAMGSIFLHGMWSDKAERIFISTVPSIDCGGLISLTKGKYTRSDPKSLKETIAFQTRECAKNIVEFNSTNNPEEAKLSLLRACNARYEILRCEKKLNTIVVVAIPSTLRNVRRRLFSDEEEEK